MQNAICYSILCFSNHVKTRHQNLQSIIALKPISKGTCSIYKVNGYVDRVTKIHEFPLKLLLLTL